MAPPSQHAPQPRHQSLLRIIATILLTLIVIAGLTVLIIWLVVRPKKLVYTIEDAHIHNYNLANKNLNATFDFVVRAYNPNRKISIYYDSVQVSVAYHDQTLASQEAPPFFQPHRNATRVEVQAKAQNVSVFGDVARDMRLEKASGEMELAVLIKARVRFKVGQWKSDHRTMRIQCSPVLVHFSSSKKFDRTYCDADL